MTSRVTAAISFFWSLIATLKQASTAAAKGSTTIEPASRSTFLGGFRGSW